VSAGQERKLVIGLIGGMGSGKSTIAELFARRGARVISGDRAGHEALRQPDIRQRIVERWGRQLLDEQGEIERRQLGRIVFADRGERQALEAMVFPWIERRLREQIAGAAADPDVRLILLDAAIMLEAGWDRVCDRLVFVEAPRDDRLRRLSAQRGWTEKEVEDRENSQMSLDEKRRRADAVIANTGTLKDLGRQVDDFLCRWGIKDETV
jgi:dephospho-CoA kinase